MSGSMLPPVLLELRSSASEFIAENKAAVESLGGLDAAGQAAAANAEAASAKESAARARLAAATEIDSAKIKASVDEQIAAEKRLATEMGQAYDEEARRAQLSTQAIQRSSKEQIAAQKEVVTAQKESETAQAEFAAANERSAARSQSAWSKYAPRVKQILGVAGAAVALESLKMASDFQRQTSRLVTAAGESESAIGMVRSGIKQIAEDTGQELSELNSGAYMIESAGYHGANALKVLKAAAQGAAVEGADLGSVGNALTTVMNDVGAGAGEAGKYMSEMVAAVGQGKMKMDDLAGSIHSVLPNAAKLGMTFPQVAGALAEMTSQGMSADQSAQNLNHTIVKLAAPTIGMTKMMAQYGLTSSDVAKQLGHKGLAGTMEELEQVILQHMGPAGVTLLNSFNQSKTAAADMHEMFGKLPPSIQQVIQGFQAGHVTLAVLTKSIKETGGQGSILGSQYLSLMKAQGGFNDMLKSGAPASQTFTAAMKGMLGDQTGLQVALHLTGENMTGFKSRIAAVGKATTDSKGNVQDWSITQNLLSVQLARTKQMVEVLAVDIGSKLIPIVSSVVGWFLQHKTVTAALAAIIGGAMVVAIGAYVTKLTWGALETVGKVGMMVASWMGFGPAAEAAATAAVIAGDEIAVASETAGTATTMAFGPIGLAIAAVGVAAMLLATHWKQVWHVIEVAAKWVWNNALKPIFEQLKAIWSATWNGVKAVYDDVVAPLVNFIKEHWGLLFAALTGGLSLLIQHWHDVWDGIKALWDMFGQPVFDAIKSAWQTTWGAIQTVYNAVIAPVFRFIKQHWGLLLAGVTGGLSLLIQHWRQVWGAVKSVYNAVIAPVFHAIGTVGRKIGDGLKWGYDNVVHPMFSAIKTGIHIVSTVVGKVVGVISNLWKGIATGLKWAYDHTIKPVLDFIMGAIQDVKDMLSSLTDGLVGVGTGGHVHMGGTVSIGPGLNQPVKPPGHAAGGMVNDGWFSTGEGGPELGLKQGNQVRIFSNPEATRMGGGGGGDTGEIHVYVVVDGKVVQKSVERQQLKKGQRRGTTYQPFARGRS